jgi:N-acyl-D-amino-acid deacylase
VTPSQISAHGGRPSEERSCSTSWIHKGTIVDGSGDREYRADVGVVGELIQVIGDLSRSEAKQWIDATAMTVAPGFIDTHTHCEGGLLVDPQHANGLRQGITTESLGMDGMSYAPLSAQNYRTYRHWLSGLLGEPSETLDMSSVSYFRRHLHKKVAVNTVYLVPHGTIRLQVLGFRDLALVNNDLETARRLVREGIEQGAVGFSTGAKYYPGPWGNMAELVELCKTVHQAGGVYMCEPREANLDRAHGGNGVLEALEIARQSRVRLHVAHYRTTEETAGRIDKIMEHIDPAKARGVDVTFRQLPLSVWKLNTGELLAEFGSGGRPPGHSRAARRPRRAPHDRRLSSGSTTPRGSST